MQTMIPSKTQAQPVYEITDADRTRQKLIADTWKAYHGLLDPPLQKMPDGTDPNVLSNRCMPVVNAGIDFLFGKEIEISVEEGAPAEAQKVLNRIWGRKEARLPLLQKLAMNGAISGQALLRIVPGGNNTFRLVVVDPATVFVQSAPQDCETVLLYCIEYSTSEKTNGQPTQVYYREEITRIDPPKLGDDPTYEVVNDEGIDADITWSIQHWSRIGERGPWVAAGDPIIWPHPFAPLFPCQNMPNPNSFWGLSDLPPDLVGLNKSLNLTQSCAELVEILFGHPLLYATGTGDQNIDIRPGVIHGLPLTESKIAAVPLVSDMVNSLKFADNLRSDIDEQSGVPWIATGRVSMMPRGSLSGIAIELLFMSLLKKTEKKQCLYGELIIDVSQELLVLNGMSGDIDITLAWQNPLPHDDLPSVQAALAKKEINISDTTLQRELGYDPDEEALLSQAEDERKLAKQMPMVDSLAPSVPGVPALPGQKPPMPTPGLQVGPGGNHA